MYFNSRGSNEDLEKVVRRNRHKFKTGLVHSYTGTAEEMLRLCRLDLYIGVSGCSIKTEDMCEVVK